MEIYVAQLFNFSAIVNGIIFSFLLLNKKENRAANKFLIIFLLSLIFTLAASFILAFKLYDTYPLLHWMPFTLTFWIGPSFYFYTKNLIEPDLKFERKHLWHFSLIILNYSHSIYHLIYGRNFPYPMLHNFTEAVGSYAIISIFIYLILSYRDLTRYQKSILNQLSTTDDLQLSWIKKLIGILSTAFIIIAVIKLVDYKELVDYSIESSEGYLFEYRGVTQLILVFTVYWLAIGGYKQLQTINNSEIVNRLSVDRDFSDVIDRLLKSMVEDKLFLNSTLSLTMLSDKTEIPVRDITIALNHYLHKNFYSFVNEFRVEEVKTRLIDPKYQHLTMLGIAFDCGFNSKATFNRLFKEMTRQSPKDFKAGSSTN
jgi:AraC-like DNA-binding protein